MRDEERVVEMTSPPKSPSPTAQGLSGSEFVGRGRGGLQTCRCGKANLEIGFSITAAVKAIGWDKDFSNEFNQNDPVLSCPARVKEATITPLGDVVESCSLKAAGIVPSANRRLPLPSVTGKILSQNSSTKSCANNV